MRGPRPHVASGFRGGFGELDVLLLGVAERPDFVALNALGGDVANRCVMEGRASLPASISSLETVLIETPVIRETERMDDPRKAWRGFERGFPGAICSCP